MTVTETYRELHDAMHSGRYSRQDSDRNRHRSLRDSACPRHRLTAPHSRVVDHPLLGSISSHTCSTANCTNGATGQGFDCNIGLFLEACFVRHTFDVNTFWADDLLTFDIFVEVLGYFARQRNDESARRTPASMRRRAARARSVTPLTVLQTALLPTRHNSMRCPLWRFFQLLSAWVQDKLALPNFDAQQIVILFFFRPSAGMATFDKTS